jgi:epoxyqueuosine reductase QueG
MSANRFLTEDVKLWARGLGAKLVGIASADNFKGAPEGFHPWEILPDAKSVVVIAVPLLYGVIEKSHPFKPYETYIDPQTLKYGMPNREYAVQYVSLNAKLDRIVQEIGYSLEERGFYAFPVQASLPNAGMGIEFDTGTKISSEERIQKFLRGAISQRHAAVLAGLGEIGLNNLFMTPEYGPRVRIASLITDAPLVPDEPFSGVLCKGKKDPKTCNLCIKSCPFNAIPESKEAIADPLKYNVVNKFRCREESGKVLKLVLGNWVHAICGICIKVCPIGKRLPRIAQP